MRILKDGRLIGSPPVPLSDLMVSVIKSGVPEVAYIASMLSPAAVLVPVPKSSLFKEGSLWVPDQIAISFVRSRLGGRSAHLLARTRAIAKAATSVSSGRPRPTALDHLQTLSVQTELRLPLEIVLVDDCCDDRLNPSRLRQQAARVVPVDHDQRVRGNEGGQ